MSLNIQKVPLQEKERKNNHIRNLVYAQINKCTGKKVEKTGTNKLAQKESMSYRYMVTRISHRTVV